jgi:hypothetical protein
MKWARLVAGREIRDKRIEFCLENLKEKKTSLKSGRNIKKDLQGRELCGSGLVTSWAIVYINMNLRDP